VPAGPGALGQDVEDRAVGEPAVGVSPLAAELAEVEQGDHVEGRQELGVDEVDVAEGDVVVAQHLGAREHEVDEGAVLVGVGGNAEDGVAPLAIGAGDADRVMRAGAEVIDRAIDDAVVVEPLDEVHVAGTLRHVEVPGVAPHVEGGRVAHASILQPRRPGRGDRLFIVGLRPRAYRHGSLTGERQLYLTR
jgi:hypothetical protein